MTQTRYLKADKTGDIEVAAKLLQEGKLVAFPTETVYGLGAHAFDAHAVERIFEAKKRPRNNPLIVHVSSVEEARCLFDFNEPEFEERFKILSAQLWPGPITLVGKKTSVVPDLVTANSPKIAVRIPSHPVALALLKACGLPIAAPSANLYTRPSPTTHEHVALNLNSQIDAILNAGQTEFGIESTVVEIDSVRPKLLRHGVISLHKLRGILGALEIPAAGETERSARASPGLCHKHYSPNIGRVLLASEEALARAWFSRAGIILRDATEKKLVETLGKRPQGAGPTLRLSDHPKEYAKELFGAFYLMEERSLESLLIEDLLALAHEPEWASICDKLVRATNS